MTDQIKADTAAEAPAPDAGTAAPSPAVEAKPEAGAARAAWTVSLPRPRLPRPSLPRLGRRGALAASLALGVALGGGAGAGAVLALKRPEPGPTAADWARIVQRLEDGGTARLGAEVKALRDGVAALKEASDRGRAEAGNRLNQMSERVEKLQRAEQEVAKGVAALAERVERADRDEAQRLAALGDRIEKKLAAAPAAPPQPQAAAPAKPADPVQTGAIADKPQPSVVAGWTLREVYDGMAMLENRNQRLLEVAPGSTVPGVGRVEAIERRGKAWVVVTAKGLITTTQSW
jgi:hypothetical protein